LMKELVTNGSCRNDYMDCSKFHQAVHDKFDAQSRASNVISKQARFLGGGKQPIDTTQSSPPPNSLLLFQNPFSAAWKHPSAGRPAQFALRNASSKVCNCIGCFAAESIVGKVAKVTRAEFLWPLTSLQAAPVDLFIASSPPIVLAPRQKGRGSRFPSIFRLAIRGNIYSAQTPEDDGLSSLLHQYFEPGPISSVHER